MNTTARQHLNKAKDYLARGDEFYRKAKPEIDAVYDEGAAIEEICRTLQKSQRWVYDVLAWDGKGTLYGSDTPGRQVRQTKQTIRATQGDEADDIAAALIENPAMVKSVVKQISEDPKARAAATKVMEDHYEKQAKAKSGRGASSVVSRLMRRC